MGQAPEPELVFVVDVSSFTKGGFVGSTSYEGDTIDIEFDDADAGIFLSSEMARRLKVRKGSSLNITIEGDKNLLADGVVASVGKSLRISSAKIYYAVGKEGGAIVRIRKA